MDGDAAVYRGDRQSREWGHFDLDLDAVGRRTSHGHIAGRELHGHLTGTVDLGAHHNLAAGPGFH